MIEGLDFDSVEWETRESTLQIGSLNGMNVYTLKEGTLGIQLETRHKEGFTLKYRADGIKPMMSRLTEASIGYTHTRADGSSESIVVKVGLGDNKDKDVENSSDTNNQNDTQASDIDSRDRDFDKDD